MLGVLGMRCPQLVPVTPGLGTLPVGSFQDFLVLPINFFRSCGRFLPSRGLWGSPAPGRLFARAGVAGVQGPHTLSDRLSNLALT